MVDKDTGQLAAHRFLQQSGRHGAVHAAAERQQYPLVADFLAALGNGRVHIGGHGPLAGETADTVKEVFQNLRAVFGVHDLGVELHAVETAPFTLDGGMAAALGGGGNTEIRCQLFHLHAVAHPVGGGFVHVGKQAGGAGVVQLCLAVRAGDGPAALTA